MLGQGDFFAACASYAPERLHTLACTKMHERLLDSAMSGTHMGRRMFEEAKSVLVWHCAASRSHFAIVMSTSEDSDSESAREA